MPYQTVMKWLGLGDEDVAEKARKEEERRREEERKKKKKKGLQPHGRWQMSDKEFEELEEASK